jgi:hypothetical protein
MEKHQTYRFKEPLETYADGFGPVQVEKGAKFIIKGFLSDRTPVLFFPATGVCLPRDAAKLVLKDEERYVELDSGDVLLGDGNECKGCMYYGTWGHFPCTVCRRGKTDCYTRKKTVNYTHEAPDGETRDSDGYEEPAAGTGSGGLEIEF